MRETVIADILARKLNIANYFISTVLDIFAFVDNLIIFPLWKVVIATLILQRRKCALPSRNIQHILIPAPILVMFFLLFPQFMQKFRSNEGFETWEEEAVNR